MLRASLLTEGANHVVLPLEKLVLAKGVLVGNRNIKDETSALQQKTPTHLSVSGRFLFELTAVRRSAL